ncbi:MAG: ABC transporter ATP-binding protein, partial [Burkholderiaceae bacterium]|nr:ABC transporter ATP-binding protein [Burkholderiaceae bacterium]
AAAPAPAPAPAVSPDALVSAKPRKLSYKEQRELDELPAKVAALEAEQVQLNALLNGTELYTKGAARIAEVTERAAKIDEDLLMLMERWEVLEAK